MARDGNRTEWRTPGNGIGARWLRFYHAPRDSRLLAPKRVPLLGWTINLGHPWGAAAMLGIVLAIGIAIVLKHGLA